MKPARTTSDEVDVLRSVSVEYPRGVRLVDRAAAARLLGISIRSLDELLATRRLRSLKLGARRLIDLRDIHAFVEAAKDQAAR